MKKFGGSHRTYRSPKRGWFSRTPKSPSRQERGRRVRHAAEPLFARPRMGVYGARIGLNSYLKIAKRALLPLLLATWFGLLIFLPYFRVTKVVFYGLQILKKDEVDSYLRDTILSNRLPLVPSDNYFLLSSSAIQDDIQKKFAVSSIVVTKVFPNELHIEMQEKISSLIYENGGQYFLLDQNGTIIKFLGEETAAGFSTSTANDPLVHNAPLGEVPVETPTTTPSAVPDLIVATPPRQPPNYLKIRNLFGNLPLLMDASFVSSTDNESTIVSPRAIKAALDFEEMLEKRDITTVKYFKLQPASGGLVVYTSQPWVIYFQPNDDLEAQFSNLKMVLESNRPTQYIDLRYGERVYWK